MLNRRLNTDRRQSYDQGDNKGDNLIMGVVYVIIFIFAIMGVVSTFMPNPNCHQPAFEEGNK